MYPTNSVSIAILEDAIGPMPLALGSSKFSKARPIQMFMVKSKYSLQNISPMITIGSMVFSAS